MDLSEFLLARITDDETAARAALGKASYYADNAAEETLSMAYNEGCAPEGPQHFARWKPARVLAECEAKRRIVEEYREWSSVGVSDTASTWGEGAEGSAALDTVLCLLAIPYADHADYDPEWSPTAQAVVK